MGYRQVKKLPDNSEVINKLPISNEAMAQIKQHRHEIENILAGRDKRLMIIVGPCSAWPDTAVIEYANRLKELNKKVNHALKLVMRVYIQKPRTIKGWTGPLNQPEPLVSPDIEAGIWYCRKMMINIAEMGLAIADECLFTHNAGVFQELLSWVAIGARSSEDQEHRIFASALDCPVGIKNPTHGALKIGVNGVIAAQHSHFAVFDGYEIETTGNLYAHLVLRGGNNQPNYSIEHIQQVVDLFQTSQINNPALIIDVSHDNCMINGIKDHRMQPSIILETVKKLESNPNLKKLVKGFMLESFIKEGKQNIDNLLGCPDMNGLSITDPCLGWEETEKLLIDLVNNLN